MYKRIAVVLIAALFSCHINVWADQEGELETDERVDNCVVSEMVVQTEQNSVNALSSNVNDEKKNKRSEKDKNRNKELSDETISENEKEIEELNTSENEFAVMDTDNPLLSEDTLPTVSENLFLVDEEHLGTVSEDSLSANEGDLNTVSKNTFLVNEDTSPTVSENFFLVDEEDLNAVSGNTLSVNESELSTVSENLLLIDEEDLNTVSENTLSVNESGLSTVGGDSLSVNKEDLNTVSKNSLSDEEDVILKVSMPARVKAYLDPENLSGKGQVYSERYEVMNYGNRDVAIEIKKIKMSYYNGSSKMNGFSQESFNEELLGDKKIDINMVWKNAYESQKTVLNMTDGKLDKDVIYLKAAKYDEEGNFVELNKGSKGVFYFTGQLDSNPGIEWSTEDIALSFTYTVVNLDENVQKENSNFNLD